jgi:hypothetical protein
MDSTGLERSPAKVFISHSRDDAAEAREVCEALERGDDVTCWIAPRDIRAGQSWPEAVITGLEQSHAVVVLLSESSNRSPEVLREIERASKLDKAVVPFRIENVEPTGGLAFFLSSAQWVDGFRPPRTRSLDELVRQVRSALDAPLPPAAETPYVRPPVEVDLRDFAAKRPRGRFARLFEDR